MATTEIEFDEDVPLSEEERIKLIDETIDHKAELESMPMLKGFADYLLRCQMNDECLKCKRSKSNLGECYGKIGGNPCLIFKDAEVQP